jgi:hypothetical protein
VREDGESRVTSMLDSRSPCNGSNSIDFYFSCFYDRELDSSDLVFSLLSHRQLYIGLVFISRFIES